MNYLQNDLKKGYYWGYPCFCEDSEEYYDAAINDNCKDTLFRFLFGSEERKSDLLSLYNALNGSDYKNPAELEYRTLDDFIYLSMKNDVSFILASHLVLYEHQSTFNPNMPLRGFLYFASIYHGMIYPKRKHDIYRDTLIKIPTPQYIVFYNGVTEKNDKVELKLSEAFECPDKTKGFEWTATMININYGHNRDLMVKCKRLDEYARFVAKIREYQKQGFKIKQAISMAVDYCIENNILAEILLKHKAEVKKMLFREFDRKEYEDYFNTKIKNLELDVKEKSAQLQEQSAQLQEQSEILQEQKSQLEDKDALLKEQAMLIEKYKNMLNANGILQ